MDVTLQRSSTGRVVVVSLVGAPDAEAVPALERILIADALSSGAHLVVVELSGCTSLDEPAIEALIQAALVAHERHIGLLTINAAPEVARVLAIAHVDEVLALGAARDRYKHGSVLFPPPEE